MSALWLVQALAGATAEPRSEPPEATAEVASSAAGEEPVPGAVARWEVLPSHPEDGVEVEALGGPARRLPWSGGAALRVSCPGPSRPDRLGLDRAGLVRDFDDIPRWDGTAWVYAPARPAEARIGWLLAPATCRVERLRTDPGPWAWAWREWLAGKAPASLDGLVSPRAEDWAGTDPLRRAALRPPGPHPVGYAEVAPGGEPVDLDDQRWHRLADPVEVTWTGPVRARLDVRDLAGARSICVEVDGRPRCMDTAPARATTVGPDGVAAGPRTLDDGTVFGRAGRLQVGLGPGEHTVRLPAPSLVRVALHRPEPWSSRNVSTPPGTATWTEPPPVPWDTVPVDGGEPVWVVDPSPGVLTDDDLRWIPVDAWPEDATRPSPDELALWLESPGGACTIVVDGTRFAALAPSGRHTLSWVGPSGAPLRPDLSAEGCRAWVQTATGDAEGVHTQRRLTRLPVGRSLRADVDPRRTARIEVSAPRDHGPVEVTARSAEGTVVRWVLHPARVRSPLRTADGVRWIEAVPLALPPGARWTVRADAPVLARVRQRALALTLSEEIRAATHSVVRAVTRASGGLLPDPVLERVLGPPPEPVSGPPAPAPSDATLRAASAAVADAADEASRAVALLVRARLLARRDELELAGRDLGLAEALDPSAADIHDAILDRLRATRERTLYGADRWRAEGDIWVQAAAGEEPRQLADRIEAAAVGDALSVAQATPGREALRWWIRAVHGGQILDSDQRLRAHRDVVVGPAPDHPALAGVRGQSTWDGLVLVDGVQAAVEVPWPVAAPPGTALLHPEAWPADRSVSLGPGWALRLAPRGRPLSLPVRCRPLHADVEPACRWVASDRLGRTLSEVTIGSWGRAGRLHVPAGGVAYVRLEGRSVVGAALWPTVRPPTATRQAWSLGAGQRAGLSVLGPTVLRVGLRPHGASLTSVTATVAGRTTRLAVPEDGVVYLPVDVEGPARVQLSVDGPAWLRLAQRRPRRGGPTPTSDRRALLARLDPGPEDAAPGKSGDGAASAPAPIPRGLPADSPPLTSVAEVVLGSAEPNPPEPGRGEGGPVAARVRAGLQSRIHDAVWLEAAAGGLVGAGDLRLGWLDLGADVRLGQGRARATLLTDLDVITGPFAGRDLTAAHGRLGIRVLRPLVGTWVFEGRASVDAHLRSRLDVDSAYPVDRSPLWSRYHEDHRTGLDLLAGARVRHGPWWTGRGALRATLNEPGLGQPIDGITAEARVDLGRPRLWTRLLVAVDVRFADADRDRTYVSPLLDARAALGLWPGTGLGLRPWVRARWRPLQSTSAALIGLEARFGPPRALADQRPSTLPGRHLGEAGFWARAAERWPAGPQTTWSDATDDPALEAVTDRPADRVPREEGS